MFPKRYSYKDGFVVWCTKLPICVVKTHKIPVEKPSILFYFILFTPAFFNFRNDHFTTFPHLHPIFLSLYTLRNVKRNFFSSWWQTVIVILLWTLVSALPTPSWIPELCLRNCLQASGVHSPTPILGGGLSLLRKDARKAGKSSSLASGLDDHKVLFTVLFTPQSSPAGSWWHC